MHEKTVQLQCKQKNRSPQAVSLHISPFSLLSRPFSRSRCLSACLCMVIGSFISLVYPQLCGCQRAFVWFFVLFPYVNIIVGHIKATSTPQFLRQLSCVLTVSQPRTRLSEVFNSTTVSKTRYCTLSLDKDLICFLTSHACSIFSALNHIVAFQSVHLHAAIFSIVTLA